VQELAAYLDICACRIVVINVSQQKDATTISITFTVLEKSGEEQSSLVLQALQQQVDQGTLVLSGLSAQSVQIISDNQSSNREDNHATSITVTIIVVVGVFGTVTVASIACATIIISNKRKNSVQPEHAANLQQHKDSLVVVQPKRPTDLPPVKATRFLHSTFAAQPQNSDNL